MALKSEYLITLLNLKGFGTKSVLKIAQQAHDVESIGELSEFWTLLKGSREKKVTESDLWDAYMHAKEIITQSEQNGIGIVGYYDEEFPEMLRSCKDETGKLDPPLVLYYRGNLDLLSMPSVAVVGTREPTPNGIRTGMYLGAEIAKKGFNVVSGLAKGCDAAAHRGALDAKGLTTAFLATDLSWNSIYPKENLDLAKAIVDNGGLLLSEYHIGQSLGRFSFVARDRLQAGESLATVVVQTSVAGGTMHAVNATINSGKPVFAVDYKHPEELHSPEVQGNISLIESGQAQPLRSSSLDEFFVTISGK